MRWKAMAIPKYQYIKDELKTKSFLVNLQVAISSYTEAEFTAMYDVFNHWCSVPLNDLAKDGYIVRQQGKGTFCGLALASTNL